MKSNFRFCCALALVSCLSVRAAQIKVETEAFNERDEKVGALKAGANVEVLEEGGEWIKVRYLGVEASFACYVKAADVDATISLPATLLPAAPMLGGDPAVTTAPVLTNKPPPAKLVSTRVGPSLALAANWTVQSKAGSIVVDDLKSILRQSTTNEVKLAVDENYLLYKELYFMMPLADALKLCGQPATSPEPVNTPGFPVGSFKAYSFDPKISGITRMMLVVDLKNQLVAVQTSDSGQKNLWLRERYGDDDDDIRPIGIWYSRDIKLYDLIGNRSKGNASWCVGTIVEQQPGVLRIDTELIDNHPRPEYGEVHSRERIRLYLPKQVANICRSLVEARK